MDQFWKNDATLLDGEDYQLWVEVNEEIRDILFAILQAFDTTFKPFVVTDDAYNQTFYVDADYQFGTESIQDEFPSAREKLECRAWLHQTFLEAGIDIGLIDKTFPKVM
jgi:hypothetical protein